MIETLQLGMIVPSAVGLCCTVADRRRRSPAEWMPAVVMLLAMVDLTLGELRGWSLVAPIAWTGILILFAAVPAVRLRLRRAGSGGSAPIDAVMATQRSLTLIVMAGLAAMMTSESAPLAAALTSDPHAAMSAPALLTLVLGGSAAVTVLSAWIVAHHARAARRDPLAIADSLAMAAGLAAMLLMHVAA